MLKAAILITVISASAICVGQPEINLGQNLYAFSGEPNARRQVDDSLLFDSDNNRIANACINGADAFATNSIRAHPPIHQTSIVPDLKTWAADRFDEVQVFDPAHLTQHNVSD